VDGHSRVGSSKEVFYSRHATYEDPSMMVQKTLEVGVDAIGMIFYIDGEATMQDVIESNIRIN